MRVKPIGKIGAKAIGRIRKRTVRGVETLRGVKGTYSLVKKLASISGPDVDKKTLDRVMFGTEALPPFGKEYWWLLFFGKSGKRPVQLMLLVFRKHGKSMLFNGKRMALRGLAKNKFRAVTAGWIYDGEKLRDLGDTNAVVKVEKGGIVSEISGREFVFSGGFPDYAIKLGDAIDLKVRPSDYLEAQDAYGVFVPPFGMGWVDVFSDARGTVLGRPFEGSAHLQKVFGVTIFGPFHWGRVVFEDNSVATFFCLKPSKSSKMLICLYLIFYDKKRNEIFRFHKPKLKISKTGDGRLWTVSGRDRDKSFNLALETYAKKEFTMKGGGEQVYIEYAVLPKKFKLKTKKRTITLKELGKGVGTFEDAYW